MNHPTSNVRARLAGACLVAMFATFLPASAAFWSTASKDVPAASTSGNSAPTAQPVQGETFTGVMIELPLTATDPDGDAVLLKLIDLPRLGTASIDGSKLQYTPQEGKTGTDKFTYAAIDTVGNESKPAQIKIKITRNKAKLTYSDMGMSAAHYAALCLAESGIMTGERIGASYFFHPNETVTRGEFIAMVSALADLPIVQTAQTDFADDSGLSEWVKPYISAAAASGLVSGYQTASGACEIRGQNPITLAEASVLLGGLLDEEYAVQTASIDASYAPAWAQNACAVLTAADVLPDSAQTLDSSDPITRETACQLLYRTMEKL